MSAPLLLAIPSKGRLQQNAEAFFARSGLELIKPRGARDYRGAIAGFDGVEIAYLSAAEITAQLAQGAVHLGVTGEDLVREMIPQSDERVVLIAGLGFGFANVVVAVPQAWIDVRAIRFSTGFGRGFDYYTGFVFELHDPRGKTALVAGGRYDGLLSRLGARAPIPAVGFAASIEELTACGGAA